MPKWRPFTWVIVVVNVLFLVWIIAGIAGTSGDAKDCGGLSQADCNNAAAAGTAIGVGLIIVLWAFVDVILGVLWMVTRPRGKRQCPVCGSDVKKGATICPKCGHDFRAAQGQAPPPPPTPV